MSKKTQLSLLSVALLSSLHAKDITLEQITVTSATKSAQEIKDLTSNINVITNAEIEEKGYTTITQALNSISGISFTSNGGLGSNTTINLRGAGNNRTLVLIDGVRYQDPSSTSGASIQHLMITDIQQIEVIKGAQSGVWGADASAGVINIITKSAAKGTHLSANIEASSFNTKKFGATVSHNTPQYDIKLSANKITSDSFSVQAPFSENLSNYEDDAYTNTTLDLKLGYNLTDTVRISASVVSIEALKEYDSYGNPDDDTLKSDVENRLYNLAYTQNYKEHTITAKIQKSDFSRDEIGTTAQYGSEYVKEFEGEYTNFELSDTITYRTEDFITIGLGSSSDRVNYIMTDASEKSQKNKDNFLYATNSNTLDKLIFTQSLRYDDYNNFDSKTTGKLGVKYTINKDLYLTANAGVAYNVPNIVQELNPWGAVNDNLNPEDTKSYDASVAYKSFTATYFYNMVTNLIDWYDPDGYGGNPAIYKNLDGESKFKGYELEYTQNITDEFSLTFNYTALSAKDKDGKNLARRAKEVMKASFDYYQNDALHFGIFGEYIGKRYDKADNKGGQTGRYSVINFITNYDINEHFSTYIKVDNILDKYYQTTNGYATPSRSFYMGINATF